MCAKRTGGFPITIRLCWIFSRRACDETQGGRRIASVILRLSIVNFLDVVVGEGEMRLGEVKVHEAPPLVGKHLKEADIGQQAGAIVVGIHGQDGRPRVNPSGSGYALLGDAAGGGCADRHGQRRPVEAFEDDCFNLSGG